MMTTTQQPRRRRARTPRGAALAAFLLAALSTSPQRHCDAFSTGAPSSSSSSSSSATARIRTHARRGRTTTARHHPKSSLSSATVAEPRASERHTASSLSSSERRAAAAVERRGLRSSSDPVLATAGIRRRSSICGSESRAHSSSSAAPSFASISSLRRYVETDLDDAGGNSGAAAATGPRPAVAAAKARAAGPSSTAHYMPPWLARPSDPPPSRAAVRDALQSLRRSMSEHSHLSEAEVHAVAHALEAASGGSLARLRGAIDFCGMLVETTEMGRDALVAAAFHYCGCAAAREAAAEAEAGGDGGRHVVTGMAHHPHQTREGSCGTRLLAGEFDAAYLRALAGSGVESYGAGPAKIAADAARLKGTEAVAAAVSEARGHSRMTAEEGDNLRSLLLSDDASGEWRALAIRVAACLYRLRGLRAHRVENAAELKASPTREEILVGREALHIYAPLAHRLGMHKLKSELEGAAFQALYRRQHRAVTALLYHRLDGRNVTPRGIPVTPSIRAKGRGTSPFFFAHMDEDATPQITEHNLQGRYNDQDPSKDDSIRSGMRSVLEDITYQVKRMLHEDSHLMDNVKTVQVAARIKEPYSLWRKMLRLQSKAVKDKDKDDADVGGEGRAGRTRPLSVLDVHDAVALRVVVAARKLSPAETDPETSLREHDLCYHVQSLCADLLGPPRRPVKDYIRRPKPNGYQSLHYSSRMRWHGEEWPFEVQIRSGDMHRVAEFGLAAHWEYKARSRAPAFSSSSGGDPNPPPLFDSPKDCSKPRDLASKLSSTSQATDFQEDGDRRDGHDSLLFATVAESDPRDYGHALRAERVRLRDERLAPYIEALSAARTDLARERVFVFLNSAGPTRGGDKDGDGNGGGGGGSSSSRKGESIVSLPSGARVLDALREEERRTGKELGLTCGDRDRSMSSGGGGRAHGTAASPERLSVLRNGSLTGMTERLENGDVLTFFSPSSPLRRTTKTARDGAGRTP